MSCDRVLRYEELLRDSLAAVPIRKKRQHFLFPLGEVILSPNRLAHAFLAWRALGAGKLFRVALQIYGPIAEIGVDFDCITLEPETVNAGGGTLYLPYIFCVTANGNAVIIEKE